MADDVTDQDRLAASLAGLLAAGFGDKPFEMARRLTDDGWGRGDRVTVTAETLLEGLVRAGGTPLTWSALRERVIGRQLSGATYARHKAEFQKLIDSGQAVPVDPEATYPRYLPIGHQL